MANAVFGKTGGVYRQPTLLSGAKAVARANATVYGLSAGVWTADVSRAHPMADPLRSGIVHMNTNGGLDLTVPLDGVRQARNGHARSLRAMDKYFDLKSAWIQL